MAALLSDHVRDEQLEAKMTGTYQEYRLIPMELPPRRLTSSRADRLIAVVTLTMRAVVIYVQG